jgi:hypothetical protein
MDKATASGERLHSKRGGNGKFGKKFLPRALIYQVHLHRRSDCRTAVLSLT